MGFVQCLRQLDKVRKGIEKDEELKGEDCGKKGSARTSMSIPAG